MNKIKERLIRLNISFNKELVRYIIVVAVLLAIFTVSALLTKTYPLFIVMGILLSLFSYLYFSRYKAMEKKRQQDNLLEFVNLFTFFKIYLKNGYGVYSALQEITKFANSSLKEYMDKLIFDIDEDKTVNPFVNFAHNFNELIVEEMMITIYQMVDDGINSSHLLQFEIIFDKFSEILYKEQLEAKDRSLSSLTSSSLIGSAYLIVVIAIGVITLLGDMLNVL